jgi:UTP--glucose-1-phosphate uridylyltransferase
MVRKVVITAAGLGTRLLPATKEMPKEMLPIYVLGCNGVPVLKPLLQALFEQLYRFGFREYCFVVGRGKRAIEDHFTPDWDFVEKLDRMGKASIVAELTGFYRMLEDSLLVWVSQPTPRGFGDAVLTARSFIGDEDFLLAAGDTYIISENDSFLARLLSIKPRDSRGASLLAKHVEDPRQYGVVLGEPISNEVIRVNRVVEKPSVPPSNLAIMPFYIFTPEIMKALSTITPGVGGELQLTDAIQRLIEEKADVNAAILGDKELWLDVGTHETYFNAFSVSYHYFSRRSLGGT